MENIAAVHVRQLSWSIFSVGYETRWISVISKTGTLLNSWHSCHYGVTVCPSWRPLTLLLHCPFPSTDRFVPWVSLLLRRADCAEDEIKNKIFCMWREWSLCLRFPLYWPLGENQALKRAPMHPPLRAKRVLQMPCLRGNGLRNRGLIGHWSEKRDKVQSLR